MSTDQLSAMPPVSTAVSAASRRYLPRPIPAHVLAELRRADDSGQHLRPFVGSETGVPMDAVGSPLRCCLRAAEAGELIALVSYAPLRRWAAETGARPGAYDEAGPVFIHADDCSHSADVDRLLASDDYPHAHPGARRTVRRYDRRGFIIGGRLLNIEEDPTAAFNAALDDAFADPQVALVHIRALEYGCFHFEVRRGDTN